MYLFPNSFDYGHDSYQPVFDHLGYESNGLQLGKCIISGTVNCKCIQDNHSAHRSRTYVMQHFGSFMYLKTKVK